MREDVDDCLFQGWERVERGDARELVSLGSNSFTGSARSIHFDALNLPGWISRE
jgi:hypothetical protein